MKVWWLLIALTLSGCGTIQQEVKPVSLAGGASKEICVIQNPDVRESFMEEYRKALVERGFSVRILPSGSAPSTCLLTSAYTANWRWDFALYLAYANLKVYQDGHLRGEALYDALGAGTKTSKFIRADEKIRELTNQLFPH